MQLPSMCNSVKKKELTQRFTELVITSQFVLNCHYKY
jgi:hypothetical protein